MTPSVREFYDALAADYHLIFPDWDASMTAQARALDAVVRARLGAGPHRVLDCSCGIGTQAIGLARVGHRVVGSDLSPAAVARAAAEAAARDAVLPVTVADMRELPYREAVFDAVVCADNSLPHLLTADDIRTAPAGMRRVLRAGGLLLLTVRRRLGGAGTAYRVLGADPRGVERRGGRLGLLGGRLARAGGQWLLPARTHRATGLAAREI